MKKNVVKHFPIAKFYYPSRYGNMVLRTVAVIESDDNKLTGYELRRGCNKISCINNKAPIKSYRRGKIAKPNPDKGLLPGANSNTTLRRITLQRALFEGI